MAHSTQLSMYVTQAYSEKAIYISYKKAFFSRIFSLKFKFWCDTSQQLHISYIGREFLLMLNNLLHQ